MRSRSFRLFIVFGLFDVVLIFASVIHQRQILASVREFIDDETRFDDQSTWLQLVGQRLHDLSDPATELLATHDTQDVDRQFQAVYSNLMAAMAAGRARGLEVIPVQKEAARLSSALTDLIEQFRMADAKAGDAGQVLLTVGAKERLAEIRELQREAPLTIANLAARNLESRNNLLQKHETELQSALQLERYYIAAIVVVLLGFTLFAIRLRRADEALFEERRLLSEERRERLASIGELCFSVAHGIRNPLAAIRSSAQLALQMGALDEPSRERLQDILTEERRLEERITGLLDFARASDEAMVSQDLREIVKQAVQEMRTEFARRNLSTRVELDAQPVCAIVSRYQIEQLLIELLSNAMEYSLEGAEILVGCQMADDGAVSKLSVEDHGPGIPPQTQSRIFDLFFTTKPNGTGIGLATVRRIARMHGGDAVFEAVPSGGARFTVAIPTGGRPRRHGRSGSPRASVSPETDPGMNGSQVRCPTS